MAADLTDIAVLVPRVRRALGDAADGLTDQQVKERAADAIAGILLFSEGEMGVRLEVKDRDEFGAPTDWRTSRELTEEEGTVIVLQAAIDALDSSLSGLVAEKFGTGVDRYEYQVSAQALTAKLKRLLADRDRAIEILLRGERAPVAWVNTLGVRDRGADMAVNPWLYGG